MLFLKLNVIFYIIIFLWMDENPEKSQMNPLSSQNDKRAQNLKRVSCGFLAPALWGPEAGLSPVSGPVRRAELRGGEPARRGVR